MNKIVKFLRWLYPGLKIKRWISLFLFGLFFILVSSPHIAGDTFTLFRVFYTIIFTVGIASLIGGIAYLIKSLVEVIYPHKEKGIIDIIYEKRLLSKGPKVVAIGGGTGLSTLLEGLKEYTSNITAIVAVSDEGGSSGRLRKEFGILPPGDIRNCLVSLAEAPQLMRDLFQYRFIEGEGIKGHSFGNIFITALTEVTGSFKAAVEESSKVLAIRGRVIPSSLDTIRLKAYYNDGSVIEGEDMIPQEDKHITRITILPDNVKANPEALEIIKDAEIIVIGPGSLFTSILPNLLIKEICDAMAQKDAFKIYICNVMTQHGETDGYTSADHVSVLLSHTRKDIINHSLINTGRLSHTLLYKYAQEKSFPVIPDKKRLADFNINVIDEDIVSRTDYLRHSAQKTARVLLQSYNAWKRNRLG